MNSGEKSNLEKAIEIWISNKVGRAYFDFSCGGDSMNDTEIRFVDENGEDINGDELSDELKDLHDFIDEVIYKRVDFYVNSDGHYQGEAGTVEITLEEGDDDFTFIKDAESEWREMIDTKLNFSLSDDEFNFIRDKVLNIEGEEGNFNIIYKNDCLINDNEEKIISELENKILEFLRDFEPDNYEGELLEYFRFHTDNEESILNSEIKSLIIYIEKETMVFTPSD